MKMKVFSVYDKASEVYAQPMYLLTAAQAVRALVDETKRVAPDNALANHPEDYTLFELGEWDNTEGKFNLYGQPRMIARVSDLTAQ